MIHRNRDEFIRMLEETAGRTGYQVSLLEKDYYLTLLLSNISNLSENLIFKGGTCLNKIYFAYFRMSEDLDFTLRLPDTKIGRQDRSRLMLPIKKNIGEFVRPYDLTVDTVNTPGRNESKQYVFVLNYNSATRSYSGRIKIEIGLRNNPITETTGKAVKHLFKHPYTHEPLIEEGTVNCLSLNELIAEKMRAGATRRLIAPRDFFDIDYVLRHGFHFTEEFIRLFLEKLKEDDIETNINVYKHNLGRTDDEIENMLTRVDEELLTVLSNEEAENFSMHEALMRINKAMNYLK